MKECKFCRIVRKEVKIYETYEDDKVLAFLDRFNTLNHGHTIIIPKKHYETIFDVDEETLDNIVRVIKKISLKMRKSLGAEGVNILNASGKAAEQSIHHLHFHIVPRWKNDDLNQNDWWETKVKNVKKEKMKEIQEKLKMTK